MPLSTPPTATPPAEVRPSPTEREARLLQAFDLGEPLPQAGLEEPSLRWLHAAATFDPRGPLPADPFVPGAARREATALRALLKAPAPSLPAGLAALSVKQSGTALALWRWGQAQVRAGRFPPKVRRAWEDRLIGARPALLRGYGLRHALCWALAERDEARFASLKARTAAAETTGILAALQRLFGLLGETPPAVRLWTLPALAYHDAPLSELGAPRLWICPPGAEGPLEPPADAAWILPSTTGLQDARQPTLGAPARSEGEALAQRLPPSASQSYFAASRDELQALGLVWFPILIELDPQGRLQRIRMGDAAPDRP